MRVVFIPTDFQPAFLELMPSLSFFVGDSYTDIIFGHLFKAKDYEQLYWKKNIEFKKVDPFFIDECKKYFLEGINLSIRNFAGSSLSGLKLFFEINRVDLIINPVDYVFKKISKCSVKNPGKIIKRSGLNVHDINTVCEPEYDLTHSYSY